MSGSSGIPVAVSCTCSLVESCRVPVVLQIMLDCWKRDPADDNVNFPLEPTTFIVL